ncbi:MAG: glycosyltransferase family 2 protein [Solirubrobacterales bacterium]|nr:glycosyltransferase family 2 protein [Solirubrobacterales bacterium]
MIEVILPVLDEAEALPGVLAAIPEGFAPLVVDNGSSDGSAAIARAHGARVVTEPQRGFGAACFAGLSAAGTEIVCFMDADGSLDPAELPRVSEPVQSGRLDLALGARRPARGAWPLHARVANRLIALELHRRSGIPVSDIGPMRAARRLSLLALGLGDRAFGWPLEMVLAAADAGWRVGEQPVTYRRRAGGTSKVSGSIRGTWRAGADMSRLLRSSSVRTVPFTSSHDSACCDRQAAGGRSGEDAADAAL